MKKIFFAFAGLLFILSACKKDSPANGARQLLIGTWKQVNFGSKLPTGKYVTFNDNGNMEGTVYPEYNKFELSNTELVFKGAGGSLSNTCTVNTDSLYIAPLDPNGCCEALFAKQQ
jgi:hypothetical protein